MNFRAAGHAEYRLNYWTGLLLLLALLLAAAFYGCRSSSEIKVSDTYTSQEAAQSRQAFLHAYDVLVHPRCLNCHPQGNRPLQGDDSHPHGQNVQRGTTGHGKYALKCSNCHQLANTPGKNAPPGSPNWHMPPEDMPMVFQARSPRELCLQLQDEDQNGGMELDDIIIHVENDDLVLWGWEPGNGRTVPTLSHDDFVIAMKTWVANGAFCPAR